MRRIRLICLLCVLFFCYCNNHDHKNISIPTLAGNTINSVDSSASKSSASKLTMHDVSLDTNDEILPCLIYNKYEGLLWLHSGDSVFKVITAKYGSKEYCFRIPML